MISAPLSLAGSAEVSPVAGAELTISGNISEIPVGSGSSLTLNGPGTLILSGTNSYTGGTNVRPARYALPTPALPEGTSLTVGAGGAFIFDASAADAQSAVVSPAAIATDRATTVPEPGMLGLLAAGGVCLVAVRLKRSNWSGGRCRRADGRRRLHAALPLHGFTLVECWS